MPTFSMVLFAPLAGCGSETPAPTAAKVPETSGD